jgi:hypothetical protein
MRAQTSPEIRMHVSLAPFAGHLAGVPVCVQDAGALVIR